MRNTSKLLSLITFIFIAIVTFNSTISAQPQNEIWIVADRKAACTGVASTECFQVKRLNEDRFGMIYQNIERFTYVPGYFYVVEVQRSTVANPPADASKYKYRLRKVLARVKSENNPSPTQTEFFGTQWKLTKIEGQIINNEKAFIRFDESKNSAGGNGGCNVFGGNLEKNGSQIKISEVFSTKMYCENGSDVENKFFANLDRVTKYEIKGKKLFLMRGETILLEFEAKNG